MEGLVLRCPIALEPKSGGSAKVKLLVVLQMINFHFNILSLRIWLLYEKSFVISINPKCVWLDNTIDYWGLVAFLNNPTHKIFGNLFDVRCA